jgi:hypothetical protein
MKNKRRIYIASFIVFVFVVWIYLWFFRGNKKAQGMYITCAGQSYIRIKSGFWGSPKIEEGFLFHPSPEYSLQNRIIKCRYKGGRLILEQQDIYKLSIIVGPGDHREYQVSFRFKCQPSKTVPGDWDLVKGEIETVLIASEGFLSQKHRKKIKDSGSFPEFWGNLTSSFRDLNFLHFIYESPSPPLSSFLHKVNDPELAEYYGMRIKGESPEKALQLAEKLAASLPDDPFISLHLVEMEALEGDGGKAIELWDNWMASYEKSAPPLLLHIAERTSQTVAMAGWKNDHPDEIFPFQTWYSTDTNLQDLLGYYKKWAWADLLFSSDTTIVSPIRIMFCDRLDFEYLSFNLFQIIRTMAHLYYFQGRQRESLELFASLYHLGQSLCAFGGLQQSRNGFGWRDSISKDILFHVSNSCVAKEDFISCRDMLDRLDRFDKDEDFKRIFDDELSPLVFFMKPGSRMEHRFYRQFSRTRQNLTRMNLQLVRAACAAQYHFITEGKFPTSEKDFVPFLKEGIPHDLFTEKDPIRFYTSPDGEFILYSTGPDGDDDKASVIYNLFDESENGDIVLKIPCEREFPFTCYSAHAKNAYDLLEQFPNGLPQDEFSNKRAPFNILEYTDEHPLVIFSFGPDRDEAEYKPLSRTELEEIGPIPTPAPKSGYTINRNLQRVMRRSETFPPPPGCWNLEPMYDPTNGATSNGDLFIEIPR